MTGAVAAVDLGATSGRVMLGYVSTDRLTVEPVARFANTPVRISDGLHWNILELYRNVVDGLADAVREEPGLASIGVDSWAVDYALIRDGRMLGTPYHYRDERTLPAVEAVHAVISPTELYTANGLQFLPFNTIYQLAADGSAGTLALADGILLIPDLIDFWLTGTQVAERTNASTTGLVSIRTGQWDDALIERLGYRRDLLPELVSPGAVIGRYAGVAVTAVGSHDTASAVVAVPATSGDFAYISCGTWGLVGVELEDPVLTDAARAANFTNEGGVDGRVRFLRNVMGLWLLNESVRQWQRDDEGVELPGLLAAASRFEGTVPIFDVDDPIFLPQGNMPVRIAEWCVSHGEGAPANPVEFVRSIVESLAVAFAQTVRDAASLSSRTVATIHLVGGGSQNELLCQLLADRSGLPVLAGPVEATAIGNVLVQARAHGMVAGSLDALRMLVATTNPPRRYAPRVR